MFQDHGGEEGRVWNMFEGLEVKRSKPTKSGNPRFLETRTHTSECEI